MNGPKETTGLSPFDSSPDTATLEDVRLFQLHLAETGMSIGNRNRIMTGVRFLFRVTLRRLDLAAEIYHLREPQKMDHSHRAVQGPQTCCPFRSSIPSLWSPL
jgi:hypothetical protein